ncbi:PQQ-binding-like beta-propeller repeat protein [Streptomyces sp. ME19-01-6]|uniref:outer membrane protein assembly factor BamB family protein n=1 Tax=Streptomyces sp. ME19-01-6 TaxID=3028686 RepID=UPI0029A0FDC1|nr:PQQ-binding-like beta-propeller repeat protein [Streptomyces sp. ME19-01-6]MDX3227826.1 PQQ-binding-like beta-propeller repeat protein [Streptomyces sp. ME19-01-6]
MSISRAIKPVALPLAGVLVSWAVVFHWLGWSALSSESQGACGGHYDPCPEGLTPVLILAFVFSFAGTFGMAIAVAVNSGSLAKPWIVSLVVVGLAGGVWPGVLGYEWLRGPHLDVAWEAPRDRPSSVRTVGDWMPGPSTLIRARNDGLFAYDTSDGTRRWTLPAPERRSVCTMSRTTPSAIGLVGLGRYEKPCDTVMAVDLSSGRELWTKKIRADGSFTRATDSRLVGAGDTVVALEGKAVVGLGLRDGAARWRSPLDETCEALTVDATPERALVVEQCTGTDGKNTKIRLSALDTRSGARQWRSTLPTESRWETVFMLSADPIVMYVNEDDDRGTDAVISFDGKGRRQAVIPRSGQEDDLNFEVMPYAFSEPFDARPVFRSVVTKGLFISAVGPTEKDDPQHVAAYSLKNGGRVWKTSLGATVAALAQDRAGELDLLAGGDLWRLDPATGEKHGRTPLRGAPVGDILALHRVKSGRYVIVNSNGAKDTPPVFAVK